MILPDGGRSYLSKLYNDEWMRANGLLATTGAATRIDALLADRHHDVDRPAVVVARTTERVGDAIAHAPGVRHQPDAGVRGAPRATTSSGSSGRSARRACSTGPSATRRSSSAPSAR